MNDPCSYAILRASMNTRKVAVIGVRNVGMAHARAWAARPDAKLVAIAELDDQRRQDAAKELENVQSFGDYRDLLAKSNAEIVSVCLPTGMHEQVVTECLRAGKHVLCEKPPASNAAEAARMAQAAANAGKVLGYGLQRRFEPPVQAARQVVQEGRTGQIFYGRTGWVRTVPLLGATTAWRLDRAGGGGGLLDLGVHLLDVAWYVMGCPPPVSASGFVSTRGTELLARAAGVRVPAQPADDTAAALIRFEGGAALLLESSFALNRPPGKETYCELSGTDGGVSVYPPLFVSGNTVEELSPSVRRQSAAVRDGLCGDFLRAVENGSEPCVSASQGVTLMRMLDAILQSAEERRELEIH